MERLEVLVTNFILTVSAVGVVPRVVQVTAEGIDEISSPLLACLTRGRIEPRELVRLAPDYEAATQSWVSQGVETRVVGTTYCNSVETMVLSTRVYGSSWYSHDLQNLAIVG